MFQKFTQDDVALHALRMAILWDRNFQNCTYSQRRCMLSPTIATAAGMMSNPRADIREVAKKEFRSLIREFNRLKEEHQFNDLGLNI